MSDRLESLKNYLHESWKRDTAPVSEAFIPPAPHSSTPTTAKPYKGTVTVSHRQVGGIKDYKPIKAFIAAHPKLKDHIHSIGTGNGYETVMLASKTMNKDDIEKHLKEDRVVYRKVGKSGALQKHTIKDAPEVSRFKKILADRKESEKHNKRTAPIEGHHTEDGNKLDRQLRKHTGSGIGAKVVDSWGHNTHILHKGKKVAAVNLTVHAEYDRKEMGIPKHASAVSDAIHVHVHRDADHPNRLHYGHGHAKNKD